MDGGPYRAGQSAVGTGGDGTGRSPYWDIFGEFVDRSFPHLLTLSVFSKLSTVGKKSKTLFFVCSGKVSRAALLVSHLALGLLGGREAGVNF